MYTIPAPLKRLSLIVALAAVMVCSLGVLGYQVYQTTQMPVDLCSREQVELLDSNINILWQEQVNHGIAFPPVSADGVAVVVDRNIQALEIFGIPNSKIIDGDEIHAFDLNTGKPLWSVSDSEATNQRRMTWHEAIGSKYYAFTTEAEGVLDNHVIVLDIKSGQTRLDLSTVALDLAVSDNFLFVRDLGRGLSAYDLSSGQQVWYLPHAERGDRGLLSKGEFVYELWGDKVERLAAGTGSELLSVPIRFTNAPEGIAENVFTDGSLIVALKKDIKRDHLSIVDFEESKVIAELDSISYADDLWPPTESQGDIFLFDTESNLHQFSIANVQLVSWTWFSLDSNAAAISSPVIYNGKVFFLASDGTLRSFDPQSKKFATLLRSNALRYQGNIPGNFLNHYSPGIFASPIGLLVSFGCRTLIAVQPK